MPPRTYPVALEGTELLIGPFPVSFESGFQVTALKLPKLPFNASLTKLVTTVTKALAGTDAGTVTIKKSSTTLGSTSHAASAALVDEQVASNVDSTVKVSTDEQFTLTTAKSTAGGEAVVWLTVKVLPS